MKILNLFKTKDRILRKDLKDFSLTDQYWTDFCKIESRINSCNLEIYNIVSEVNNICPNCGSTYIKKGLKKNVTPENICKDCHHIWEFQLTNGLYDNIKTILYDLDECIQLLNDVENNKLDRFVIYEKYKSLEENQECFFKYATSNDTYKKIKTIFEGINIKTLMVILTKNKCLNLRYNNLNEELLIKYFGIIK